MLKVLKYPELRKKILFSLLVIVIFRLLSHIPSPGVDIAQVRAFLNSNEIFGLMDLFSGGGFQNFSIVTLGLGPYINASIIMQLFMVLIPSLEELAKEGEYGKEKINMYTKLLTVPMTLVQAYGIYFMLLKGSAVTTLNPIDLAILMLTLTAGTMFLVWIGDLVTEYGLGNGISLLIFVSIIGRLPVAIYAFVNNITPDTLFTAILFVGISLLVIAGVVMVNEGTRNIPVEDGRVQGRAFQKANFLPVKINQAGVISIIFAASLVMIPTMIAGPLQVSGNQSFRLIGAFLAQNFSANSVWYNLTYFILVVAFTYFYTAIQFNSEKVADDIKKRGKFIPGIRPGKSTAIYLKSVVNKITLGGALFLGLIAILPFFVQSYVGVAALTVGGTSLLIVVSVVLETVRQMESFMVNRNYGRYLG